MYFLRLTRNKSLAEAETIDEILDLLFRKKGDEYDLEPSFYKVPEEDQKVIQIHAEHTVEADCDPQPRACYNLEGLQISQPIPDKDGKYFQYRKDAHHILRFDSSEGLRSFVENIRPHFSDRGMRREKSEVENYAAEKYNVSDAEWLLAYQDSPKVAKWLDKVLKKQQS